MDFKNFLIMKKAAYVLGLVWMIFFGLSAVHSLFSQTFDLDSPGGMGYFLGYLLVQIGGFLLGYFAFRWGRLRKNKPVNLVQPEKDRQHHSVEPEDQQIIEEQHEESYSIQKSRKDSFNTSEGDLERVFQNIAEKASEPVEAIKE